MDFIIDFIAIFVLIVGTERWAQTVMVLIGLLIFLFGHWFIGVLFWGVTYAAWRITRS